MGMSQEEAVLNCGCYILIHPEGVLRIPPVFYRHKLLPHLFCVSLLYPVSSLLFSSSDTLAVSHRILSGILSGILSTSFCSSVSPMLSWVIKALRAIRRFLKYQKVRSINKPYYRFHHVSSFSFQYPGDAGAFQCVLCLSVAAVHRGGSQKQI